jgi:polyamine oxidase
MVKATLFTSIAAATLCVVSAKTYHTKVAILGGGVSGISALLNLTDAGIDDFMVIEARDELGGEIYLFEKKYIYKYTYPCII